jgi:hypothetical protein
MARRTQQTRLQWEKNKMQLFRCDQSNGNMNIVQASSMLKKRWLSHLLGRRAHKDQELSLAIVGDDSNEDLKIRKRGKRPAFSKIMLLLRCDWKIRDSFEIWAMGPEERGHTQNAGKLCRKLHGVLSKTKCCRARQRTAQLLFHR